jgi:apolipoprotein N-acyltransferase
MAYLFSWLRSPWLWPVWSGIFIGTSYIPFPPWAALFAFVPLWLFWQQQTRLKTVLLGGLITAFVFTLIGFNWVAFTLHEFAQLEWPFAVLGLLFYGLIANTFVPLAGVLWFLGRRFFKGSERWSLFFMAIITALCQAHSLTLFDWNFGYSWYGANLPVYQWAETIGFSGLSALTILTHIPLTIAWQNRRNNTGKLIVAAVLGVFIALNGGGMWLKARLPAPDSTLNALLVQASISSADKLSAELGKGQRGAILKRYTALTAQTLQAHPDTRVDFAVWPETAFPSLLGAEFVGTAPARELSAFLREQQLALLTGAYGVDPASRLITNSLFVLDNNGVIVPPHYSKTILLALGEFIPGEDYFPQIRNWLPATGHFARGAGPTQLLGWNGFKMGAQICYESLFPAFSRSLAQLGAQFIVNVTNDSWYGDWQEPYQHLYMTLARGVEFRRPVLRVTNTGISTVALASGEILEQSPVYQAWAGVYKVPYRHNPPATFYQRNFWLVPALLWGALVLMLVWGWRKKS